MDLLPEKQAKQLFTQRAGVELRDVQLPDGFKWPLWSVERLNLTGVRMIAPSIGAFLWVRYRVKSCVLKDCQLDGLRTFRATFTECCFERVRFAGELYAHLSKTEFSACRFIDCSFSHVDFRNCSFVDCTFEGGNISDVNFFACRIDGGRWAPRQRKVNFIDCDLRACHMADVSAVDSGFVTCQIQGVALPCRLDNFVLPLSKLQEATEQLKPLMSAKGYQLYVECADLFAAPGCDQIIDDEFIDELNEDDRRIVMNVLYDMSIATGNGK